MHQANIYYTDQIHSYITEILAGGGTNFIETGMIYLRGVTFDAAGNIFVSNNLGTIKEFFFGGYTVNTPLPAGLVLDRYTGAISGTPYISHAATNYTITAANSSGSSSAIVNIKVNLPALPNISYTSPHVYTASTAIAPLQPTNTGGKVPVQTVTTLAVGFGTISGVAVDSSGNIYLADNTGGIVQKMPAGGGAAVTIGTGFKQPQDIAVDAAGNVYVADYGNSIVKKIPAGGGSAVTIGSGFTDPYGIAVDASGNIYVSEPIGGRIKKMPPGGGTPVIITTLQTPYGIAVDAAGNIYAAVNGYKAILKVPAGGGNPVAIAGGLPGILGVTLDTAGNIYFFDGSLKKIPAGGGLPFVISSGSTAPIGPGLAVDSTGNVYTGGNSAIAMINTGGYSIDKSLPAGLVLNPSTGIITGTPYLTSPATNYTITANNSNGNASAVVNIAVNLPSAPNISYITPHAYTIGVAIAPLSPSNTGGQVPPQVPATFSTGYQGINGLAVDASGNVYVAGVGVVKVPVGGGKPVTIASGFNAGGVALDGAGNVYATDNSGSTVKKIPAGGGSVTNLGSGFTNPLGIAVDATGKIYVTSLDGTVKVMPAGGGTPVTIATHINSPYGLAIDPTGTNVYVANRLEADIIKIRLSDGAKTTIGTGTGNYPKGIAIDAIGNIFYGGNTITEIPANGGPIFSMVAGGIPGTASGVALDSNGNLYIATTAIIQIVNVGGYFIKPALPEGLVIDHQTGSISGTPHLKSPATNYTVIATNAGGIDSTIVNIGINSNNDDLSALHISNGVLSPAFATATTTYTVNVGNGLSSITLTPTLADTNATVKVRGVTTASGTASAPIPLAVGPNVINTQVIAQDGITKKTYTVTVTRAPSSNANLAGLHLSGGIVFSPAFATATTSYTATVDNSKTSTTVKPISSVATSTITVNGATVASGTFSGVIPLAVGYNTITTVVTAQDGTTTKTYTITITRATPPAANLNATIASGRNADNQRAIEGDVKVQQGLSPNGDGANDVLTIDGIAKYPDNKLSIMSRGGQLVYEAKGYDNHTKFFDGHSNKTGKMQQAGTYFYQLEYKFGGVLKRKTGFIVLKY